MTSKEDQLGSSSSFARAGQARSVRRQLTDAAFGVSVPNELPLGEISANPDNPREALGDVSGMAASLAEIGQVQAITVASVDAYLRDRPERASELDQGASYVVVDGHRRLAGARAAGLVSIKVTVDDLRVTTDEALLEAAFVANAQRENLSDLEEAQALKTLVAFYGSQHKAAGRLGVTQPYISQRLSLLELTPDLQADLQAGRRKVEHVRGLAKHTPEEQRAVADRRAQQAEEKKQQRKAPLSQPSPDNGVITATQPAGTRADAPEDLGVSLAADNAVISTAQASPETGRHSDTGRISSEAGVPSAGTQVPWHSPQALNNLAREHMTAENRVTLSKLLAQE